MVALCCFMESDSLLSLSRSELLDPIFLPPTHSREDVYCIQMCDLRLERVV
jgi:hypothetical protein